MSPLAIIVIALGLFTGGVTMGIKWHAGQDAIAANKTQVAREAANREQHRNYDRGAGEHAATLQTLNDQLGDARAQLARKTTGRACLSPGAVGVLNDTGVPGPRSTASDAASAPATAASGPSLRWSTDIDVGNYIALCRTRYGALSSQLNQILDIEERRHPAAKP